MAFWGSYFVYDGIPCTEFGLQLYEVNGVSANETSFSMLSNISEDRIAHRNKPFFYGVTQNDPLTFKMVFGANQELADSGFFYESWDKEAISSWLSPVNGYKWLEVEQPDMEQVRYRCIITKLSVIEFGNLPLAYSCEARCDSPFAYLYPTSYSYTCRGTTSVIFHNRSSCLSGYYPKLKITLTGSNSVQIINRSANNRTLKFTGMPQSGLVINVDNENGIITNSMDLNLYPYFNFEFLRLLPGDNQLEIIGNCILEIQCEFPISVGG